MNKKSVLSAIFFMIVVAGVYFVFFNQSPSIPTESKDQESTDLPTSPSSNVTLAHTSSGKTSSVVRVQDCNVAQYNPQQDCAITQVFEQNTMRGTAPGGVNFCTYKVLNSSNKDKILYIIPVCEEYYIDTTDPMTKVLRVGDAYVGGLEKVIVNRDGTIVIPDIASIRAQSKETFNRQPVIYQQRYFQYIKTEGVYEGKELFEWNRQRAEDYFNVKYSE